MRLWSSQPHSAAHAAQPFALSLQDQAASAGAGMHPPSRSPAASARSPSSCCSRPLSVTAALEALSCARPASTSAVTLAGEGGRAGGLERSWAGSEARQKGIKFMHPVHQEMGTVTLLRQLRAAQLQPYGSWLHAHLSRCSACNRLCRSFTRS